jgi:hypothetical protein
VAPEDIGSESRWHCKAGIYRGEDAPTTEASMGVDPQGLVADRAAWPSTNSDTFNQTQLPLLLALTIAPAPEWPKLWIARLLREHMIVTEIATNRVYYVLGSTKWCALMLELSVVADRAWITADPAAFHGCMPVVCLGQFKCHSYAVLSQSSPEVLRMGFALNEGVSMLAYCCQHWLHLLQSKTLQLVCAALSLTVRKSANQLELSIAVLNHCQVSVEVMDDMVQRIKAIMAKRSRKTQSRPSQAGDPNGQGEDNGPDAEEEAHGVVEVSDVLNDLAGGEVDFVMGKADATKAITEEETDEAMDKLAEAAAAATGPASKRPRVANPSSASSSARAPAPLPPSEEDPVVDAMEVASGSRDPRASGPVPRPMRIPRAEDMVSPHPRCTLRSYARPGETPYWVANLPKGVKFGNQNATSRCFHNEADGLVARQHGYLWLKRAVAAGVLD